MSNLPLFFCESELTRQYTNLPAVAVDTLRVNMERSRQAEGKNATSASPSARNAVVVDLRNARPIRTRAVRRTSRAEAQLRLIPCKQCRNCPFASFRKWCYQGAR
ncbi:hypothetical protein PI124_g2984 [Phytophthora idaei]|nr:hypothetical protein PI125_g2169 [Phytophthora idaei]KAG3252418.1 hypothetical protein PI124_g2984 [Phytophthora idaei]